MLWRYAAGLYARVLALVWSVLVLIVVAVTLVESAGELAQGRAGGQDAAALLAYNAVIYGYQVLPIACGLAVLVAGALLARRGELLGMQAGGVRPRRLWAAVGVVLLAAVCGAWAAGEWAVPWAVAGQSEAKLAGRDQLRRFYTERSRWLRHNDLILFLPAVRHATQRVLEPVVFRVRDGIVAEVLEAETLHFAQGQWWLMDGQRFEVERARKWSFTRRPLQLEGMQPVDLLDVARDPRQIGAHAVWRLIQRRQRAGFDVTAHRIELHNRMAYPLFAVCLVFLLAPWAFSPNRGRSLAVSLGAGVGLVAVVLAVMQVFRMLALAHVLPPWLGAWGLIGVSALGIPCSLVLQRRHRLRGGWL